VDEPVRVTVVPGEAEAEALCGLLRSEGLECAYRPTEEADSAFEGFGSDGHQEILVHEADLERAREILGLSDE
jgi:putative signal transducing protein